MCAACSCSCISLSRATPPGRSRYQASEFSTELPTHTTGALWPTVVHTVASPTLRSKPALISLWYPVQYQREMREGGPDRMWTARGGRRLQNTRRKGGRGDGIVLTRKAYSNFSSAPCESDTRVLSQTMERESVRCSGAATATLSCCLLARLK